MSHGKEIEGGEEVKTISKEQIALLGRLKTLIRVVSRKTDLEVTTDLSAEDTYALMSQGQDPATTWFYNRVVDPGTGRVTREYVRLPEAILENTENVAKGKASHEAAHAAISRLSQVFPKEDYNLTGFAAVALSVEERPTDDTVRVRFEGAGEWVDEARRDNLSGIDEEEARAMIATSPKFAQLCDIIVHERQMTERHMGLYDPKLVEFYRDKVAHVVREIEKAIPKERANEREVLKYAKLRYKLTKEKLWPMLKELIEEDIENQAKSSLEEILKQALKQAMERLIQEKEKGEGESEEGDGNNAEQESGDSEGLKEEIAKKVAQMLEKEEGEEGEGEGEGTPTDKSGKSTKQIMSELSPGAKEELRKMAEQELRKAEDEIVKKTRGVMDKNPIKTHAEVEKEEEQEQKSESKDDDETNSAKERLEAEKQRREWREKLESDLKEDLRKKVKDESIKLDREVAIESKDQSAYERVYQQILEVDKELYRRLNDIFHPNIKRTTILKPHGSKINLQAVYRWEADKGAGATNPDTRIFESVRFPEKRDYTFTILVDLSGSMGGQKIEETFKAVVVLTEVLNRLGIKYELLGFQDEVITFKKFDERLDDSIRSRIAGMPLEVWNLNPRGHNNAGDNDDGPCLEEASQSLARESGKEKFLLVLSDGIPAGRRSNEDDLTEAVKKIVKTTDQKLVGVGLGEGTEHVQKFYPNALPNVDINKLPEVLGDLLEDMIVNPGKFTHKK